MISPIQFFCISSGIDEIFLSTVSCKDIGRVDIGAISDVGLGFTDVGLGFTDVGLGFTDVGLGFTDVGLGFTDVGL
ncbi:MAG: hypothetical protein PHH70_04645, partial [Candidatus Gracilibacteria bacterium]|nr:hypothetical protein [Candidatus Gracilibacteria bacterium]